METITPLPTPVDGWQAYRLKPWSEKEAIDLVKFSDQYMMDANLYGGSGHSTALQYQDPIRLAVREALSRYPDTSYRSLLEWRFALADVISWDQTSDVWILQQLEMALNDGSATPDTLQDVLTPHGFILVNSQPAPNLFGDGQVSQVYQLSTQLWGMDGLYFALSKESSNRYRLRRIFSFWHLDFGEGDHFEVGDHTHDGIPEVTIVTNWRGGFICEENFYIFQWNGERFVDLGRNSISNGTCPQWHYGPPDANGYDTLDMDVHYSTDFFPEHERYRFDGSQYTLDEAYLITDTLSESFLSEYFQTYLLTQANSLGDLQFASSYIDMLLKSPPADVKKYGASLPDYLRLMSASIDAFNSNSAAAHEKLNEIIQSPANPITLTISLAAQAYLDNYQGDLDVYRACQAALAIISERAPDIPPNPYSLPETYFLSDWGYSWRYVVDMPPCSLDLAFRKVVESITPSPSMSFLQQLHVAGVRVYNDFQVDLNGDGISDWVIIASTPWSDIRFTKWIVLIDKNQFVVTKNIELYSNELSLSPFTVTTYYNGPENLPLVFIHIGSALDIYQPMPSSRRSFNVLAVDYIDHFRVNSGPVVSEVHIEYKDKQWKVYRWSYEAREFIEVDANELEPPSAAKKAESLLFEQSQPAKAIPLLLNWLAQPHSGTYDWLLVPYYRYQLGLAYEMVGDSANAVKTYWSILRENPGTPYAAMASRKLLLISPK